MKISQVVRSLILYFLLVTFPQEGRASNFLSSKWPPSATVTMHLGLGPTNIALQDGFVSWNASAADTLAIWNGYLDFINIGVVFAPTVPQASGDGINSVFYSNTIFGDSFDSSTLAVTVIETTKDPTVTAEADVIVNTAFRYDSYRGPLQSDASGPIVDLHRVLLHEFGHVLGLDHVTYNPPGQAIMEPIISDLDHLGFDDVDGIRSLYGADISDLYGEFSLRVGDNFYHYIQQANNSPTSFTATGLPPGLSIDSTTGTITGTAKTAGEYNPVITAHGPIADAYGSIKITVSGLNEVPGLLATLDTDVIDLLADPVRPRLYAAGADGINMIDTETLAVTQLVPNYQRAAKLSFSADNSLLCYVQQGSNSVHRIDLETFKELPVVPIPYSFSRFLEGLDHRAYTTGLDIYGRGVVYQLDSMTGAVQATFGEGIFESGGGLDITMTPDRKTLVVTVVNDSISTYDISTPSPVLLAKLDGSYSFLVPSLDSHNLYSVSDGQLMSLPLPGFVPQTLLDTPPLPGQISVAPDGTIYDCGLQLPGLISIFDPVSLKQSGQLDITYPPFDTYEPYAIVFDSMGKFLFVGMSIGGSTELWKFSTDFASFPPPDPIPTKNLLNISTRAKVDLGEEAMIGGFIVQGPDPKKVLVRGLGPSLPLSGALSDPVIELYDSTGKLLTTNDNWIAIRSSILASHVPPLSPREAAISITLDPGAYTTIVHDRTDQPGAALVEVYDIDAQDSLLANISTRGKVGSGDDVMIGGFIIGGNDPTPVLIRAIGPSLSNQGVKGVLADPMLVLHDANADVIQTNDNWRSTQEAEITATGIAPKNDNESAILVTLSPGSYTAIVSGQSNSTGIALVEIYNLATGTTSR